MSVVLRLTEKALDRTLQVYFSNHTQGDNEHDIRAPTGKIQRREGVERILMASMALPGAKVDRASYLASQLSSHCDDQQVAQAILNRPASAGISPDLIDKLADDCISPNPPMDTDGRREDTGRRVRKLQKRWSGLEFG